MEVEAEGEGCKPVRIFVGGLGGAVTAEDLQNTFSSLGSVKGVEIVRTNCRSFAYMDFQPSSSKALSKLFSMYNGCVWKGGRLRLEKAKEHYLVRLKREWDEDAKLASDALKVKEVPVVEKKIDLSEKLKSLTQEKMQLQIFFPKFRNVRSLPYRGSGKHKYSFQRIQVPPLPIHFCECEEHCGPTETTREHVNATEVETDTGIADEEEVNMMRYVLDKILKRENNSGIGSNGTKIAIKGDHSSQPNDDLQLDENEAEGLEAGGDDLVINMVSGENGRLQLMEVERQGTLSTDEEIKFIKRQFSGDSPASNKLKGQKRKKVEPFNSCDPTLNKKTRLQKSSTEDERNHDDFTPSISKKRDSLETLSEESKVVVKHQTPEQKSSSQQSTRGLTWSQKSPWKKMVGETSDKSFSISHILPETAITKSSPISDNLGTENPTGSGKQNKVKKSTSKSTVDNSKVLELGKEGTLQDNITTENCVSVLPSQIAPQDSEEPREAKPTELETNYHQSIIKPTLDVKEDLELGKEEIKRDEVLLKTSSEDSEGRKESKLAEPKVNMNTVGPSWIQKSSWRDLVGETNNSSFSITHILPDIASTSKKVQPTNSSGYACSSGIKPSNLGSKFTTEGSRTSEILKDGNQNKVHEASGSNVANPKREVGILAGQKVEFNLLGTNSENEKEYKNSFMKPSESKSIGEPNKKAEENVVSGKLPPFIRSEASEKEWLKLKTALAGSKKNRIQK